MSEKTQLSRRHDNDEERDRARHRDRQTSRGEATGDIAPSLARNLSRATARSLARSRSTSDTRTGALPLLVCAFEKSFSPIEGERGLAVSQLDTSCKGSACDDELWIDDRREAGPRGQVAEWGFSGMESTGGAHLAREWTS